MLRRTAVLIAIWALSLSGCKRPAPSVQGPAVGQVLPAVTLVDLQGNPVALGSRTLGKVVLVSLWATWCEPCLAEIPALMRFAERTRAGDLGSRVMPLAVAVGESRTHVAGFVAQRGFVYDHLVDEEYTLADALGQRRVPATLIVGENGRIAYAGGAFDEEALKALRDQLGIY